MSTTALPTADRPAALARLRALEGRALERLEGLTRGPAWLGRVTLAALALVLLLSPPDPEAMAGRRGPQWPDLEQQVAHPLAARGFSPELHQAKTALRLTVPVTGHVLGLGRRGLIALDALAGVLLFPVLAALVARATGDRLAGALVALCLAGTYAGVVAFNDYLGPFFDSIALALLALAMLAPTAWLVAPLVLLAAFTDERAALGALLVPFGAGSRPVAARLVGVAAGLVLWLALRLVLERAYGLRTPIGDAADAGPAVFFRHLASWPLATFAAFEGLWAGLAIGLAGLVRQRRSLGLLMSAAVLGMLVVAGSVLDATRSALFVLPALPLALAAAPTGRLRPLLLRAALVSWVFPNIHVIKGLVHWLDPLWVRVAASMIRVATVQGMCTHA